MTTETKGFTNLIKFTLEQAEHQPVAKRIELYRTLAAVAGDEGQQKKLLELADDLEKTQRSFREFVFSFSQKSSA